MIFSNDTIIALSTGSNIGAIAVIRISGELSFSILEKIFVGKDINNSQSHKLIFGKIIIDNVTIDEVVIGIYKTPNSYTGQDTVEIMCHGSKYIVSQIIEECIALGCRLAEPGEFTKRAFLNGKMDLSQAEAVADLIASENATQHKMAWQQFRGNYNLELQQLRERLINFAALIELELDFSEEDVEFADRKALRILLSEINTKLQKLASSFKLGNAIKKGIPVVIIGKPNVGKSTLLNALLNEEKAIVSDIAGTTRDVIEDVLNIGGYLFRFIDTAGLRATNDEIEIKGIEKTKQKITEADIILLMVDAHESLENMIQQYQEINILPHQYLIFVINKIDSFGECNGYDVEEAIMTLTKQKAIAISAKQNKNIDKLSKLFTEKININEGDAVLSNQRHLEAINKTIRSINEIEQGFDNALPSDLISIEIKLALNTLGSITGQIEMDRDVLGTVFGKFCIGK